MDLSNNKEIWNDLSLGVLKRVRIAAYTVILSLLLIFVLDFQSVSSYHIKYVIICRSIPLSTAILLILFSYLNPSIFEQNYQNLINLLLLSLGLSSIIISPWAGGFNSQYYLGIVQIEFAYVTYIPITRLRALINVIFLNLVYILYNIIFSKSPYMIDLINICIRLFTFALITIVAHHILHCYRIDDYTKRKFIEAKNYELIQQKEDISVNRDSMELMYNQVKEQAIEIANQNTKIEEQQFILQKAYNEIQINRKNIVDSINYAKRIQDAILPSHDVLLSFFPNSFIFSLPKDIVSGDFYWIKEFEAKIYVVVADCTGHGVPGAFMSVLGLTSLNASFDKLGATTPDLILNDLRDRIKKSLGQTGKFNETKDGMDLTLICIDKETNVLDFAAAYNSLYIYRSNELIELKGDRMPIGIYMKEDPFKLSSFQLYKNDLLYLFTDGYHSQFGGFNNHKLMIKGFKNLLKNVQILNIHEQAFFLDQKLVEWKGRNLQVDDITVIGINIHK